MEGGPLRRFLLAAAATGSLAAVATSCGAAPSDSPSPVGPAAQPATATATEAVGGVVEFDDAEIAVSGRHPIGWHRARALSGLGEPREALALASYPLRGGATAGECAPSTAREDMPADGVFVWLLEYRPSRGDVWADLPRDRFPPRPERFELGPADLGANPSCFPGPGYSATFRAADRPFQLLVAFGAEPTAEQLQEVNAILDSLAFEELRPPPPDPYAGWPLINDDPGDSLRVPPGWAAAAAMFAPGAVQRPRPLFFSSNRALAGLPAKLTPHVDALPGPFPGEALEGFPAAGVLVWVLEEGKGAPSPEFPQIEPGWPDRSAFRPTPTKIAPDLHWHRAGGSFRGYRFSVWVAAGPEASSQDLELGFESAASLAVSGCWRDATDDCPDG